MPKVSVIIPVYNVENYLAATMESVLTQTFNDFEIICVNDGSQDSSGRILEQYKQRDRRIKIITQENQGVSAARNNAFQQASGEYISFFDSDDLMHPQFLEVMASTIKKTGADFVWCDFKEIEDQEMVRSFPKHQPPQAIQYGQEIFESFLSRKPNPNVMLWNKLYRIDLIRGTAFVPSIQYGEDYVYNHQVIYHAASAWYVPACLVYYRRRVGSISNSMCIEKMIGDRISGFQILMSYFKDKNLPPVAENFLKNRLSKMALKFACFIPKQRDKTKYLKYWEKFSPIIAELQAEGIYKSSGLNWRNRFKSNLFCQKMFGLLKVIVH